MHFLKKLMKNLLNIIKKVIIVMDKVLLLVMQVNFLDI